MGRESIRVTRSVSLDPGEIELRVSRSSGPGGQHANKAETRVEAVLDVEASGSLSAAGSGGGSGVESVASWAPASD